MYPITKYGAVADGKTLATAAIQKAIDACHVAGELDQVQVHDELMRRYRPDIALAADVRPLPPEHPDRVYPYAAEIAALMVKMNDLPPYMPYIVLDETRPLPGL